MILHHYPNSPFAEKIRAIFGYKGLAWQSVIAPDIMPKPDLQALTGGYRRIPVLQMGADIYCDTALIVQVLETVQPQPSLYSGVNAGVMDSLAAWADDMLFWAAMGYNFKGAAVLFAGASPEQAALKGQAFAQDRAAMFGSMPRQKPNDATAAYHVYLHRIHQMLQSAPYVGGSTPCAADFALYHPLWFTAKKVPQLAHIFEPYTQILTWLNRMFEWSDRASVLKQDITAEQALDIAKLANPKAVDNNQFMDVHGITVGQQVSITAEKFGLESTVGELIAADLNQYVLRGTDERVGTVHVHFPRVGFALKRMD